LIGKSVWTAGERSRLSDFSGRPIRLPMRVGARSRISKGATSLTAFTALSPPSHERALAERSAASHVFRSPSSTPSDRARGRHAGIRSASAVAVCSTSSDSSAVCVVSVR